MGLRDRVEAQHDELVAADAALQEANRQKVLDKRARMADDSGENTAVPPEKMSI